MNSLYHLLLKAARKVYLKVIKTSNNITPIVEEEDPDKVSRMIYDALSKDDPCMVARLGANELSCIVNYLAMQVKNPHAIEYIKGNMGEWWGWNDGIVQNMFNVAGFFPPTNDHLKRFAQLMLEDAKEADVLAVIRSTKTNLSKVIPYLSTSVEYALLVSVDPFRSKEPWSRALEEKRVLVVHPFAEDIKLQYENRGKLFSDSRVLPEFASLRVVKAIQSHAGEDGGFSDWFEALEWMKSEMDKEPYDVALIGCGAYGFPLAAHSKRTGHKAVHLGGSLQLLFGIKGKRWDNPNYHMDKYFNEYWINPSLSTRPKHIDKVEDGCYW